MVFGSATHAFGAKPRRVRLSDCFSIERSSSVWSGTSINIYTTMPGGEEKLIGQMDDPASTIGHLGFGSTEAVSVADRTGLETRWAVSADGRSMVFYSRWPVGHGAERTQPGIHRYVCGRGDSLLHGEDERVDEFGGGASFMKSEPDKMFAVLHKRGEIDVDRRGVLIKADGSECLAMLYRATPLHDAAYQGDLGRVDSLIASGADLSAEAFMGDTPLDLAFSAGHQEVAKHVLDRMTPDPDARHAFLLKACTAGQWATVRHLLDGGANPNEAQASKFTALRSAMGKTSHSDTKSVLEGVTLLLDHGADPNLADGYNVTPLYVISWANVFDSTSVRVAQLLIARGADPSRACVDGQTPLHRLIAGATENTPESIAAWGHSSYHDVLALFVEHAKDLDRPDAKGLTPVQWAISGGRFLSAEYLLEHGASGDVMVCGDTAREIVEAEKASRKSARDNARFRDSFKKRWCSKEEARGLWGVW